MEPAAPARKLAFRAARSLGAAQMACVALLAVLCSAVSALAQQCTPTGTNQTCTNSIFLTGGANGLFDNGTAPGLTVTNTNVGTISGAGIGGGGMGILADTATVTNNGTISGTGTGTGTSGGFGILANTATVNNNGTISGTGGGAIGIETIAAATVTNNGTISGTGTGGGGIGIFANTATVTNNSTISGTGTGTGSSGGFGILANTATVTNNGTISGTGGGAIGIETIAAATVTNNGTISGAGIGGGGMGILADTATVTNNGTISGTGTGTGSSGGFGILANTATVTNNGTISGTGGGAIGIETIAAATVTNNGTISGTGTGGGGIGIFANTATVTNNSTISGTGTGTGSSGGFGILANTATVTNNGTISGTGTGGGAGTGINTSAAGNVTNNGTITGTTFAISFAGSGGNTLTLGPTSIINGEVMASGVNNLLQLGGSGIGSFDVSLIGPAVQYRGFDTFNKIGAATWTLTGFNAGALPWTVQQGILLVNGSLANSPFTVNGGTLGGTGTIGNTQVNSGGTLAPGSGAPGTSLTITGNLAFRSGALYLVQINSTTASLANVTGTASLAGTVQANISSATSKSYDILHSAGLGGTRFNALVLTNPNFSGSLSYTATDVFLTPTANLGAGSNLNQNQQNVAGAINNFFNNGGALPPNFVNIFGLTGGALGNALTQLDGEAATGAERAVFQLTNEFLTVMLDPFVNGRGNVAGGGGAIGFAPDEQTNLPPDIALAYASILTKAPPQSFEQRWSAWGSAYGGANNANGDPATGSNNVRASTFGFAGGMDYHVTPYTVVGFALAGAGTNWGLANALGTGRSDALQAGAYGISWFGPAYLAGALSFSNHWFTTNRSALGDALTANFVGQGYGARLEGGYRYAVLPAFAVTPYGAVQFQDFHTPAYSETDVTAGGFGLSYNAMNATDVRTELGARFDDPTVVYNKPLILFGRLAWAHDFVSNPMLSAAFQALPGGTFTVNGAAIPQNSALTTAGAQLFLTPQWTLLAKFEGEFAPGSQTYAGTGMLRYTW